MDGLHFGTLKRTSVLGLALLLSTVHGASNLRPALEPKGLLKMRSLRLASTAAEGSRLYFGSNAEFSIGTDANANFLIQQASNPVPLLSLDAQRNTLHLGAERVEALSVDAVGGFSVRGVRQWQLVSADDFTNPGIGWSRQEVTQCAGVHMLGGYCKLSKGEVNKTYTGLPPHKQLKVVATYHFIDRWIGEAGYMKLGIGEGGSPVVVWSEQHSQQMSKNGLNLCGQVGTPEGKFSTAIDVTVPHSEAAIELTFGSTMEDSDPCDESWGVSSVELYIRS